MSNSLKLRKPFLIPDDRAGRLQVQANGGGTQSIAMTILMHAGALPKPDIIVMVDTERESTAAIEYQNKYIKPLCDDMDVEHVIVKKSEFTKDDITTESDDEAVLPPFFTDLNGRDSSGKCGKQPGWCSDKWKTNPMRRFLNARYGEKELTARGVDQWIGMSLEEGRRIRTTCGKWQSRYPLFQAEILRSQSIQIVVDYGLPTPPRSACWMCPNRHDDEWQLMKEQQPEDFAKAVQFERDLQREFPWLWLHKNGKPIDQIDFVKESRSSKQLDIYDQFCDTGMCFV